MPKSRKYLILIDHSCLWHDSSFDSMPRNFQRELKSSNWATIFLKILIQYPEDMAYCHPLAHAEEKLDDQIWFDLADAGQEESWYRSQVGKLLMTKENRIRRVKVTHTQNWLQVTWYKVVFVWWLLLLVVPCSLFHVPCCCCCCCCCCCWIPHPSRRQACRVSHQILTNTLPDPSVTLLLTPPKKGPFFPGLPCICSPCTQRVVRRWMLSPRWREDGSFCGSKIHQSSDNL